MNYTILIADDEPEIRTLLRLYLENENYQIIEAENGKQALELLKKEHVDLCLLDIMMPEMDGYHVLQELRKTSNIPVMILSAKDADSEKILGLNLGADDYQFKYPSVLCAGDSGTVIRYADRPGSGTGSGRLRTQKKWRTD